MIVFDGGMMIASGGDRNAGGLFGSGHRVAAGLFEC